MEKCEQVLVRRNHSIILIGL